MEKGRRKKRKNRSKDYFIFMYIHMTICVLNTHIRMAYTY